MTKEGMEMFLTKDGEIVQEKTEEMEATVQVDFHTFRGCMRVTEKLNDYIYNVELDLLDDQTNANGWRYVNLEKHRAMFAGKPILIAYVNGGTKIGDGHNMKTVRDREGNEYVSFTDANSERIIGSLSDQDADIRIESRDGHTWIVGKGTIWAWYAAEAVEKIASQGRMDISIETLVSRSHMEGETEVEEEYVILGATILGDDVSPAVRGANIRPLSARDAELKELKMRAASYVQKETPGEKDEPGDTGENGPKPEETGEKTQKGVKKFMNRKKLNSKMQALFPDDIVLNVSDDEKVITLCSKADHDVRGYAFADEETVMDAHFMSAVASVKIMLNDGSECEIPLHEFMERMNANVKELSEKLESEVSLRQQSEQKVSEMSENMKVMRRAECKRAIRAELDKINLNSDGGEQIDGKICEEMDKDIDGGMYDECKNAEGGFCGVEKACSDLKARCMDILTGMRKNSADKRKNHFAWESMRSMSEGNDPVVNAFQSL